MVPASCSQEETVRRERQRGEQALPLAEGGHLAPGRQIKQPDRLVASLRGRRSVDAWLTLARGLAADGER